MNVQIMGCNPGWQQLQDFRDTCNETLAGRENELTDDFHPHEIQGPDATTRVAVFAENGTLPLSCDVISKRKDVRHVVEVRKSSSSLMA